VCKYDSEDPGICGRQLRGASAGLDTGRRNCLGGLGGQFVVALSPDREFTGYLQVRVVGAPYCPSHPPARWGCPEPCQPIKKTWATPV
jgi:hypothetical protein